MTVLRHFPPGGVPAPILAQVLELVRQPWPAALGEHDPQLDPTTLVLEADGRVVSSCVVLRKTITHDGQDFAAAGLSSVVTDERLQGSGYGRELVEGARAWIASSGVDVALFTCDTPMAPFYERAGWSLLPGTVLIGGTPEEPFPSDQFDKITLGDFFTEHGRRWADSFAGARIALYPGSVDKLW